MAARTNLVPEDQRRRSKNGKLIGGPRLNDPPSQRPKTAKVGQLTANGRIAYATKRAEAKRFLETVKAKPSVYTPEVGTAICHRIASGETLNAICAEPLMPSYPTVYAWSQTHGEFAEWLARAREIQSHALADRAMAIADDTSGAAGWPAHAKQRQCAALQASG